jgi:hypothetical protein
MTPSAPQQIERAPMADDQTRQFIDQQLKDAGLKPNDDLILDYAMCVIELQQQMNMKLHERVRELEGKLKRKRVHRASTRSDRGS